ncbi:MAG: hypothetical protein AVDCRST_MAG68-4318, partial [uncultured Gemmatimonadetes bacterium]
WRTSGWRSGERWGGGRGWWGCWCWRWPSGGWRRSWARTTATRSWTSWTGARPPPRA